MAPYLIVWGYVGIYRRKEYVKGEEEEELTGSRLEQTASLGRRRRRRIDGGGPRRPGGGVASRRRDSVEAARQRRRGGVEAASGQCRGGRAAASGEERGRGSRVRAREREGIGLGRGGNMDGGGTILMVNHPSVRHKYIHTNGSPHPGAPLVFFLFLLEPTGYLPPDLIHIKFPLLARLVSSQFSHQEVLGLIPRLHNFLCI